MPRNRIDVHAHYLGGSIAELFRSGLRIAGGYRVDVDWSPDAAIAFMDRHDIAAQVLSVPATFAGGTGDTGLARAVNEKYAEIIAAHPDRFGAFAALPGSSTDAALAELEHALDVLHLDGVLLNSNTGGHYFGSEQYAPLLAELERRRVPAFLHPADSPVIVDHLGLGRPSSVCEFTFDTARTIIDGIYRGVFRRHPGLTLILAHCGGPLPTLGWRIAEHSEMGMGPDDDHEVGPEHIRTALGALYYETALAGSRNSLLPTLEVTGTDHILFGTDWPAAPETNGARNTANLTGFGFSGDELAAIERGNAARLFPRLA